MQDQNDKARHMIEGILTRIDRGEFGDLAPDAPGDEVLIQYLEGGLDAGSARSLDLYFAAHPQEAGRLAALRAEFEACAEPEFGLVESTDSLETVPVESAAETQLIAVRGWRHWRPAAAAALCTVLVAAGYGSGRLHGKYIWDQSADELRASALNADDNYRKESLVQLQNVGREIADVTKLFAQDDPRLNLHPADQQKMRLMAEQALGQQGLYAITTLVSLQAEGDAEARQRLRKILTKVLQRITRAVGKKGASDVLFAQIDTALAELGDEVGDLEGERLKQLRDEIEELAAGINKRSGGQ